MDRGCHRPNLAQKNSQYVQEKNQKGKEEPRARSSRPDQQNNRKQTTKTTDKMYRQLQDTFYPRKRPQITEPGPKNHERRMALAKWTVRLHRTLLLVLVASADEIAEGFGASGLEGVRRARRKIVADSEVVHDLVLQEAVPDIVRCGIGGKKKREEHQVEEISKKSFVCVVYYIFFADKRTRTPQTRCPSGRPGR